MGFGGRKYAYVVLALLQICLMDTVYIDNNFDNLFFPYMLHSRTM